MTNPNNITKESLGITTSSYSVSLSEDEVAWMKLMYQCEDDRAIRERLQRFIWDIMPPSHRIGYVFDQLKINTETT